MAFPPITALIPGKDIDDGLTLLYLNQQPTVDLLGVTLTFGNGTVAQVQQQTTLLAKMFALSIDIYAGLNREIPIKKQPPANFWRRLYDVIHIK